MAMGPEYIYICQTTYYFYIIRFRSFFLRYYYYNIGRYYPAYRRSFCLVQFCFVFFLSSPSATRVKHTTRLSYVLAPSDYLGGIFSRPQFIWHVSGYTRPMNLNAPPPPPPHPAVKRNLQFLRDTRRYGWKFIRRRENLEGRFYLYYSTR